MTYRSQAEIALVGKTLKGVTKSDDGETVTFHTTEGDVEAQSYGDCCSHTWIEGLELPALGFPALVVSVEGVSLGEKKDPEHECLSLYGLKVTTDKGLLEIDFRNSSNGYYGGSLMFPGDYGYGRGA